MNARVLFVCVGNSCRSQMAEALARHHGLEAASAGTQPAAAVARHALEVLVNRGVATAGLTPKLLDMATLGQYARTITMGCGVAESCPSLHTDEDWGLEDPVGQPAAAFEQCLQDIEARVLRLKEQLHGVT
jgi:arsenate reductase